MHHCLVESSLSCQRKHICVYDNHQSNDHSVTAKSCEKFYCWKNPQREHHSYMRLLFSDVYSSVAQTKWKQVLRGSCQVKASVTNSAISFFQCCLLPSALLKKNIVLLGRLSICKILPCLQNASLFVLIKSVLPRKVCMFVHSATKISTCQCLSLCQTLHLLSLKIPRAQFINVFTLM